MKTNKKRWKPDWLIEVFVSGGKDGGVTVHFDRDFKTRQEAEKMARRIKKLLRDDPPR